MLEGKIITLLPYTKERCHELYKIYVSDPMMTEHKYSYDKNSVDLFYNKKVLADDRCFFAISIDNHIIGEIQIKRIDRINKHGTLSIIIVKDEYKNKGYGNEAIRLILEYAEKVLKINKVYADAIHRNIRSQHVLETIGFEHIRDDEVCRYYVYRF